VLASNATVGRKKKIIGNDAGPPLPLDFRAAKGKRKEVEARYAAARRAEKKEVYRDGRLSPIQLKKGRARPSLCSLFVTLGKRKGGGETITCGTIASSSGPRRTRNKRTRSPTSSGNRKKKKKRGKTEKNTGRRNPGVSSSFSPRRKGRKSGESALVLSVTCHQREEGKGGENGRAAATASHVRGRKKKKARRAGGEQKFNSYKLLQKIGSISKKERACGAITTRGEKIKTPSMRFDFFSPLSAGRRRERIPVRKIGVPKGKEKRHFPGRGGGRKSRSRKKERQASTPIPLPHRNIGRGKRRTLNTPLSYTQRGKAEAILCGGLFFFTWRREKKRRGLESPIFTSRKKKRKKEGFRSAVLILPTARGTLLERKLQNFPLGWAGCSREENPPLVRGGEKGGTLANLDGWSRCLPGKRGLIGLAKGRKGGRHCSGGRCLARFFCLGKDLPLSTDRGGKAEPQGNTGSSCRTKKKRRRGPDRRAAVASASRKGKGGESQESTVSPTTRQKGKEKAKEQNLALYISRKKRGKKGGPPDALE